MSTQILEQFEKLDIKITDKEIHEFENAVINFEIRGTAPIALNSPLLGVHRIYFLDSDRSSLFSIFGVDEKTVERVINKIPFIISTRKVSSDAFNVFAFWLMHVAFTQIHDEKKRHAFLFNVAKFVHYKFFTSLVNHAFPHGATEKIMVATINSLTKKYDIVIYGTWRRTIEARCEDLISPDTLHYHTLETGVDDKAFIYAITDTQTRIRDKIGNVVTEFYHMKDQGTEIVNRSSTTEIDGEKVLIDTTSSFDTAISSICSEVLSINLFVDRIMVQAIAKQFKNISSDMLRSSLVSISEIATVQSASGKLDEVGTQDGLPLYIGMRALITGVIQKSYRYCMKQHINMSNKAEIYTRIKNVYSSSRISDPDIIAVKNSIAKLTYDLGKTKRATTQSSLRLAILLYIILKSFAVL